MDTADRGADPEGDATLTMDEMEHLIATWIVGVWQRRQSSANSPPAGILTAATARTRCSRRRSRRPGSRWHIPSPDLFYELLPVHYVTRITRRGVKVRGLWYDSPVLDAYRGTASSRGGEHKNQWVIRRDPRDRRSVFFWTRSPAPGTRFPGRACPRPGRRPRSATPGSTTC